MATAEGFGDAFVIGCIAWWILPLRLRRECHKDAEWVGLRELLGFREGINAVLPWGGEADGVVTHDFDGDLIPCQAVASVDDGLDFRVVDSSWRGDDRHGFGCGFL